MQWLCAIPTAQVGRGILFLTLTYPDQWPGDWQRWKGNLRAWFERLRRRLPEAGATWKLEPQRRGAPHFHLLVVGVPYIAKDWLSRSWYEVVGSGDPRHLAAGTNVQLAHSHRGVLSYAAKYCAKAEQLPPDWQGGVGRWWGVYRRKVFDVAWTWRYLTEHEFWIAQRIFRRLVRSRTRDQPRAPPRYCPGGSWVVLADTHAWRLLEWLDRLPRPDLAGPYSLGAALSPEGA
jgi:hypothetical protein